MLLQAWTDILGFDGQRLEKLFHRRILILICGAFLESLRETSYSLHIITIHSNGQKDVLKLAIESAFNLKKLGLSLRSEVLLPYLGNFFSDTSLFEVVKLPVKMVGKSQEIK